MKAFLVVDIPEEWANKRLVDVRLMDIFEGSFTLYQQKIRPLPKKKPTKGVIESTSEYQEKIYQNFHNRGFNECLDEITGETE